MALKLNQNKFLSNMEYDQQYALCKSRIPTEKDKEITVDHRNAVLILVAMHTGARAEEILPLTPNDFTDQPSVCIKGLKGSNDREVPLPTWLMRAVRRLFTGPGLRIFDITYKRLFQIWNEWRVHPRKTFHCLRHTFALRLYEKTKDVRLVKYSLGHKNLQSTMFYVEYCYSQGELRKALGV